MLGRIERQGFEPQTASIMATTEDMRSWMKGYPEVHGRIVEITKNAIAFQCHPDKFNLAVDHSMTYTFEWFFMSMLKGNPGYGMEQFFNFGSQELRDRLAAKEDSFDEIVGELTGVKPKDIHPLFSRIREHSAMHDHVEKFGDDATREGVDAMIRQRHDEFLQNHIFIRVFPEANKYVNGVAVSDNFEAIRASSDTITALLHATDEGELMATTMTMGDNDNDHDADDDGATTTTMTMTMASNNKEAIRKELATFNSLSQCSEEYVRPPNEVLREGYERAMLEKFASIIQEMKTTGETKTLVVIERDYLNHLSEEFRKTHLTSCFSERLFMKKTSGASIYILVTVSYHGIAGACIHNQSTRINNIVGLLKDLKLMRKLDVIDDKTHDRERDIFTRCAIECEGLVGTSESPVGSINFASLFATGENYFIRKVKGGVKYLGDILSGGVGMNDLHTISLYVLLGNSTFAVMMKSVFNMELDGLDGDFLVRWKREHKRRNVDDRKELEKRVSNGDKLDTADEATLSKLSAAHERTKKHDREHKQRKVVDRKELEKPVSNGDKLDTADEATLSKLTAAHESYKKHSRDNNQRKVVDRKELEKRVSNGNKLDTADEATLSKLSAAHERTKKHDREHKQRNVVDRKDLEKRESNGDKLDTAEEATLSKLTAAHESNKKDSRERHQCGVKKRWSAKEDSMLARLVGESNSTKTKWKELSCQMVDRTPKQCRDHYNNSLKPDGKKGQWTREEDENIIRMQAEFGNKWSKISSGG